MNKKYLFGMLLSGALLAACTADDALDAAKVANKGEMAAPVFTVSLDNGDLQNRSEFVEDGWKVKFEAGDKLSLFHGIAKDASSSDALKPTTNLNGWQNAIYLAAGDADSNGGLKFSTQSMVQRGFAIMVFPADEGFEQMGTGTVGETAPVIKINAVQKAEDKDNTPYISEFLYLDDDDDTDYEKAGYGKDYDVALKRAAGTLTLELHNENAPNVAGADPLEIRAVEVAYPTAVFPLRLKVNAIDLDGKFEEDHPSWAYGSGLALEPLGTTEGKDVSKSLKTKDVVGNKTATFTILPWNASTANSQAKNGEVKVYTNSGIVTISTKDDEVFGKNLDKKLDDIITEIADGLYGVNTKSQYFKGEYTGKHATTHMGVDLSKLEIDGMHVDNTKDLNNLLKVFEAGECTAEDEITLYLDGDSKNNFTMNYETWKRVAQHMKDGDVKFVPCSGGQNCPDANKQCKKVTLEGVASGSEEVPAMTFETTNGIQVDLAKGDWTYKSATSGKNAKVISGVSEIHVVKDATLTPTDYIAVKGGTNNDTELKLVIDAGGKMTVGGIVRAQIDLENSGIIDIGESGQLIASKTANTKTTEGKTITNCAVNQSQNADGNDKYNGLTRTCGVINNEGSLMAEDDDLTTGGRVINYGTINVGTKATTAVNKNATDNASFATAYATNNKIGEIILKDVTGGGKTVVKSANHQGFIKFTIDKDDPTIADFGGDPTGKNCCANYIILSNKVTKIRQATDKDGKEAYIPGGNTIKYLEIQGTVDYFGEYTMRGLIVPAANNKFSITSGSKLNLNEGTHLKGTVELIGTLSRRTVAKYYGGVDGDAKWFGGPNK